MIKRALFFCFLMLFASAAFAQTATTTPTTPQVTPVSFTATAIALPGGGTTIAAAETGVLVNVTNNFSLRDKNVVGSNFQYFGGGFNYYLPSLSTALNNISPTLDGLRFQFWITGSAGVDRVTQSSLTNEHYAFTAGGGVSYALSASGTWTLGAEVEYAKFPGLANNTAIVKLGPSIHF